MMTMKYFKTFVTWVLYNEKKSKTDKTIESGNPSKNVVFYIVYYKWKWKIFQDVKK